MINISSNERVMLFYGKTNVWNSIRIIQNELEDMKEVKEDGGI